MENRYTYAQALNLKQAQARLEQLFACGEISEAEQPKIEEAPFGYIITLLESSDY